MMSRRRRRRARRPERREGGQVAGRLERVHRSPTDAPSLAPNGESGTEALRLPKNAVDR
jgi:hypothetical protein